MPASHFGKLIHFLLVPRCLAIVGRCRVAASISSLLRLAPCCRGPLPGHGRNGQSLLAPPGHGCSSAQRLCCPRSLAMRLVLCRRYWQGWPPARQPTRSVLRLVEENPTARQPRRATSRLTKARTAWRAFTHPMAQASAGLAASPATTSPFR